MYICENCKKTFSSPAKITEKHGLSAPPYEILCICPYCKSENYRNIKTRYCRYCSAKRRDTQSNYCSDSCKNRGEEIWGNQKTYTERLLSSPIYKATRMVTRYNKTHGTNLSYGQFFAIYSDKEKGGRKNG